MSAGAKTVRPTGADSLAWLGEPGAAMAELAFGRDLADGRSQARHLALLPAESLDLDLSDPAQRRFGDYELVEVIGEGGMGVVYRARQVSLDRDVALKLLAAGPWASNDFVERFRREAQNAARMQHPHIVAIYEIGTAEELHFFSMRLVRGRSLAAELLADGPFDAQRAAQLMRTIAEAVAYAHSLGVLHLDLKPANVLLDEHGEPHVADFGLARRLDNAMALDSDEVSGTPSYMAPEQAELHGRRISAATDVWGLGAILYELVAGVPPFRADTAQATLKLVRDGAVRPARSVVPSLPVDLEAIAMKCLARDPAARYASARGVADDLGRFVEGRAVRARPLNTVQRAARWVHREPRLAAALALVAFSLLAGLAATTLQWRRAESNAVEARSSAARADTARQLLAGVFEQADADENKGRPLTPHQLLENGEKLLAGQTSADAGTRADLTGMIGTLYWNIGDYERAQTLLTEAERISASDAVPPVVKARNQLALAKAANEKNQYDAAIAAAMRARELAAQAGDDGRREASDAVRRIADAKIGKGETKEAEAMLRGALAEDTARFGADSVAAAVDMSLLATALLELSRMDEAISMATSAIEAQTRIHGRNNTEVTYSMGTLAVALRNTGRYAEAERVLRDAIAIEETMFEPNHRELLTARSNLLIVVEAQGRFDDALQGREALLDAQKKLAANRPDVLAYAYKNIAADLLGLGRFAEAEKTARMALDQWKAIQGADNEWHSVAARDILATALQYQGRYDEAETVWRETLAIQRQREPATSIWLNATRGNLGGLLRLKHADADAVAELRAALADLGASATPVRANLLAQLAEAELDAGHATEAREAATNAVAIARDVLPAKNFKLGVPLFALARVELADGHAERAEALLREALAVRSPPYGAEDPRVLEVKVSLVLALRALHHDDEARAIEVPVDAALAAQKTAYALDLGKRLHPPAT